MPNPLRPALRLLNRADRSYAPASREAGERRRYMARRTGAYAVSAALAAYYRQLEQVHEAIGDLGHSAVAREVASDIQVLRPLPQDRLYGHIGGSHKYSMLDTGQGFTLPEYTAGTHRIGSSKRRFHVATGPRFEGITGVAIPWGMSSGDSKNISKLLPVRSNGRPEDLVAALDGSGRTWNGAYVPYHSVDPGATELPIIGAREDPKIRNFTDNTLEAHRPITPGVTGAVEITDKTRWLAGVEDKVHNLQP